MRGLRLVIDRGTENFLNICIENINFYLIKSFVLLCIYSAGRCRGCDTVLDIFFLFFCYTVLGGAGGATRCLTVDHVPMLPQERVCVFSIECVLLRMCSL